MAVGGRGVDGHLQTGAAVEVRDDACGRGMTTSPRRISDTAQNNGRRMCVSGEPVSVPFTFPLEISCGMLCMECYDFLNRRNTT